MNAALSLLILRLSLCPGESGRPAGAPAPAPAVVERRLAAMGTLFGLSVEAADRPAALEASEAAAREVARLEELLSTWKPGGPIERLNRAAAGERVPLGDEAACVLAEVFAWNARTGGAFDPTVLPLVEAYDLRGEGRVPGPEELSAARRATGVDGFAFDGSGGARKLCGAAGIDEGAWGKGYALDRAAEALRARGVSRASLDLGGQILVLGRAAISVADPRERRRPAVTLTLVNASVSTSGNSERGLTVAGRRIGHLLDPASGEPAADFGSATAVAPTGLVADVLSTAFFVLGPEKGLALSESLRREGFANEALFLVIEAGRVRVLASPGLSLQLLEE